MNTQEYLEKFRYLRNNYSDEIPAALIHSFSENSLYKCRKAFLTPVNLTIQSALEEGLLSADLKLSFENLKKYNKTTNYRTRLTTRRDIIMARMLLFMTISELEARGEE